MSIEIERLSRTFKPHRARVSHSEPTLAVDRLTLSIGRGELFGLLGANGAGKTTTIRVLATLLLPSSGRASVGGYDVARQSSQVRRRIGYVFGGDAGFYGRLTGRENLEFFAEMQKIDHRQRSSIIDEVLLQVDLRSRAKERVESYSRGMRQRLHLARGLLTAPEVLFLDEPSIGVDPVAARSLRKIVKDLANSGTTVLLTSHYLSEVEEMCDRIGVMNRGRLVYTGSTAALRSSDGRFVVSIELSSGTEAFCRYLSSQLGLTATVHLSTTGTYIVRITAHDSQLGQLVSAAGSYGYINHTAEAVSLEDAYVALVDQEREP